MSGVFVGAPPMNHSFLSFDLILGTQGRGVISSLTCMSCRSLSASWGAVVASKGLLGVVGLVFRRLSDKRCRIACLGAKLTVFLF